MSYESGGVVFVGCVMLGLGIGMLFDNTGAGVIIGIGVGFLAMAVLWRKK